MQQKNRRFTILSILVVLTLALAACTPAATTAPTDTVMPAVTATSMATAVTGPAILKVSQSSTLGSYLTDANGMTLYAYAKDTPGVSNCTAACLQNWPALLTVGAPVAGDPAITGTLGTLTRSDGGTQVTYNGSPLYYFVQDKAPGDTKGQGVGSVWAVVPPAAASMAPTSAAAATMPAVTATAAPTTAAVNTPTGPATVKVATNATLGAILVDSNGMTLYVFTKDTTGVSTCTGGCSANWPPFLTNGAPVSGDPSITGTVGTLTRADGTTQVTINGMPLYHYGKDMAAGDANGQAVGSVWFTVLPSGSPKQ